MKFIKAHLSLTTFRNERKETLQPTYLYFITSEMLSSCHWEKKETPQMKNNTERTALGNLGID